MTSLYNHFTPSQTFFTPSTLRPACPHHLGDSFNMQRYEYNQRQGGSRHVALIASSRGNVSLNTCCFQWAELLGDEEKHSGQLEAELAACRNANIQLGNNWKAHYDCLQQQTIMQQSAISKMGNDWQAHCYGLELQIKNLTTQVACLTGVRADTRDKLDAHLTAQKHQTAVEAKLLDEIQLFKAALLSSKTSLAQKAQQYDEARNEISKLREDEAERATQLSRARTKQDEAEEERRVTCLEVERLNATVQRYQEEISREQDQSLVLTRVISDFQILEKRLRDEISGCWLHELRARTTLAYVLLEKKVLFYASRMWITMLRGFTMSQLFLHRLLRLGGLWCLTTLRI